MEYSDIPAPSTEPRRYSFKSIVLTAVVSTLLAFAITGHVIPRLSSAPLNSESATLSEADTPGHVSATEIVHAPENEDLMPATAESSDIKQPLLVENSGDSRNLYKKPSLPFSESKQIASNDCAFGSELCYGVMKSPTDTVYRQCTNGMRATTCQCLGMENASAINDGALLYGKLCKCQFIAQESVAIWGMRLMCEKA